MYNEVVEKIISVSIKTLFCTCRASTDEFVLHPKIVSMGSAWPTIGKTFFGSKTTGGSNKDCLQ